MDGYTTGIIRKASRFIAGVPNGVGAHRVEPNSDARK